MARFFRQLSQIETRNCGNTVASLRDPYGATISLKTVIRPVPSFHLQTQAPGLFL